MANKPIPLPLLFKLNFIRKDMQHNWTSTLLLVSVISFVCLPNFILLTLKEQYIEYMRREIIGKTAAMRIEIQISNLSGKNEPLTKSALAAMAQDPRIEVTVPHRTRVVSLETVDGRTRDYDVLATTPDDPDLVRYEFDGRLEDEVLHGVILNSSLKGEVKLIDGDQSIELIVSRTVNGSGQEFIIPCKVLGWVNKSAMAKVYLPLKLADLLEYWRMGYAIEELNLPPSPRQEEDLLSATASERARLYPSYKLTSRQVSILNAWGLNAAPTKEKRPYTELFHEAGKKMYFDDWQELQRELGVEDPRAVVNPLQEEPVTVGHLAGGESFDFFATVPGDPKSGKELENGNWLTASSERFDVIFPKAARSKQSQALPISARIVVGATEVPVRVVGFSNNSHGFGGHSLIFRLRELQRGDIAFHEGSSSFGLPTKGRPEITYIAARVHAASLDQVPLLCESLRAQNFIVSSAEGDIQGMNRMNRLLGNLVLLIFITGSLAFVFALVGILSESVNRRRRLIGSLLAIGVSRWDLVRIYLLQVLGYALLGYVLVTAMQFGFSTLMDTAAGHQWLGIAQEQPLFQTSMRVRLIILGTLLVLCTLAGTIPAFKAAQMDPGVILKE